MKTRNIHHRLVNTDSFSPGPRAGSKPGPRARAKRGFTLAEVMCSLMIFATVATGATYMMGAMSNSQTYFRNGTENQSEIEFALGRIVENVRAASAISSPSSTTAGSTLTLTTLSGATVMYKIDANHNLVETSGGVTSTLVHGATLSAAETSGNAKAFTITISTGTDQTVSRTVTVFGRNL